MVPHLYVSISASMSEDGKRSNAPDGTVLRWYYVFLVASDQILPCLQGLFLHAFYPIHMM